MIPRDALVAKITEKLIEQGRKSATGECLFLDRLHVKEIVAGALAALASSPSHQRTLFTSGVHQLHSGETSAWKIECERLTDGDWFTIAQLIRQRIGRFSHVEGVPTGGIRLAHELLPFASNSGPVLIVDDVLTTGASMEQQRAGREAIGAVVFARGSVPPWVTPLFTLSSARGASSPSPTEEHDQEKGTRVDEQTVMPPELATAGVGGNSGDTVEGLFWHEHEAKAAAHAPRICEGR